MLKTGSVVVFLYGGNIPFVVSLCFASQRIPTACPCCAGSISTIGLAPFCFKSAGLALSWASAVLLWFLALLYIFLNDLSIRRVHKDRNVKLCSSWKMEDGTCKMPLSADLSGGSTPLEWNSVPCREDRRVSYSKAAQKFRAVCGGFCAKQEKVSTGYYASDGFVLK